MFSEKRPYTLDRLVRIVITGLLLWGLVWLMGYLSDVLIPFAVALLLAYLINPLVALLQKKITNTSTARNRFKRTTLKCITRSNFNGRVPCPPTSSTSPVLQRKASRGYKNGLPIAV